MKTCGDAETSNHTFLHWHWLGASGQLHAPAALPPAELIQQSMHIFNVGFFKGFKTKAFNVAITAWFSYQDPCFIKQGPEFVNVFIHCRFIFLPPFRI
jgi:hypothetical protein